MHPLLNTAVKAALDAGKLITRSFERLPQQSVMRKGEHDFVTKIEFAAEEIIIESLRKNYPDHGIMAEESGGERGDEYTWIVDPLNGTLNYIHGYPHFCVSLALLHKERITHAVVYDPLQQELFTASRGQGAQSNDRRLRVSTQIVLEDALLAGSLSLPHPELTLRQSGTTTLDLAYVASGRLDGLWESNLNIWQCAAGSLLVEEAGGLICDWQGAPFSLNTPTLSIIAANPKLLKQLFPLVPKDDHLLPS